MKRKVAILVAIALVLILGAVFFAIPKQDVVAIRGDGTIQLNSKAISIAEISRHSFRRPVVVRTFADTTPEVMQKVLDALAEAGADADFEGGKYQGQRPNLSE